MLAEGIVQFLNEREKQRLDCQAFLGAVWIDCGSRVLLSESQKNRAKEFCAHSYPRINLISPVDTSSLEVGFVYSFLMVSFVYSCLVFIFIEYFPLLPKVDDENADEPSDFENQLILLDSCS